MALVLPVCPLDLFYPVVHFGLQDLLILAYLETRPRPEKGISHFKSCNPDQAYASSLQKARKIGSGRAGLKPKPRPVGPLMNTMTQPNSKNLQLTVNVINEL